jgi:hypothetical protein
MTPEAEIIELKAKTAALESQIALIKKNLQIKEISEDELSGFKARIINLENQISLMEHAFDRKDIVKEEYGPYIPYITPQHVESIFTPSKWQHCISQQNKE